MKLGTYIRTMVLGGALVLNPVISTADNGSDKVNKILGIQKPHSTIKINPNIKQEYSFFITMIIEELGKLTEIDLTDTKKIIRPDIYTLPKNGESVFVIYPKISIDSNENVADFLLGVPYDEIKMKNFKVFGMALRGGSFVMLLLADKRDNVEYEELRVITLKK